MQVTFLFPPMQPSSTRIVCKKGFFLSSCQSFSQKQSLTVANSPDSEVVGSELQT